jgi:hypothetical protein
MTTLEAEPATIAMTPSIDMRITGGELPPSIDNGRSDGISARRIIAASTVGVAVFGGAAMQERAGDLSLGLATAEANVRVVDTPANTLTVLGNTTIKRSTLEAFARPKLAPESTLSPEHRSKDSTIAIANSVAASEASVSRAYASTTDQQPQPEVNGSASGDPPPVVATLSNDQRKKCGQLAENQLSGSVRFTNAAKKAVRMVLKFTKFSEKYKECRSLNLRGLTVVTFAEFFTKGWKNFATITTRDYKPRDPATGQPVVVKGGESRTLLNKVFKIWKPEKVCAPSKGHSIGKTRRIVMGGGFDATGPNSDGTAEISVAKNEGYKLSRAFKAPSSSLKCYRPEALDG